MDVLRGSPCFSDEKQGDFCLDGPFMLTRVRGAGERLAFHGRPHKRWGRSMLSQDVTILVELPLYFQSLLIRFAHSGVSSTSFSRRSLPVPQPPLLYPRERPQILERARGYPPPLNLSKRRHSLRFAFQSHSPIVE